ncbi:relaxase/mobilization nuclease domain-containing protein [Porphyromonadaceae bacterium W3.11]|nr:relaxase/mobilization nuclease domain-containing protein [Porphyromonadaceae bacterium W3.11]
MIAKIIKGTSFSGVVRYVLSKPEGEAVILKGEGVRESIVSEITQDFDLQASMNCRVRKRVCHTILSFSPEDADKLNDALMTQIAEEYLKRMDVRDTQYLMVRHYDREHPHLHICFNRIDNYGKTISDRNEKYRSTRICKELTEEFGLTFGKGKELVKRQQLKGNDKIRYEIFDVIQHALRGSKDWKSFTAALSKHGVTTHFKHKGKTDLIEGVLFEKDGVTFSGSKIDRSYSYSKLNQHFKQIVAQQAEQPKETENFSETATVDLFPTTYATSDEIAEAIWQRKLRYQANKKKKGRKL